MGRLHAVRLRGRTHGGPCRIQPCALDLPLPGHGPASSGGLMTNSRPTGHQENHGRRRGGFPSAEREVRVLAHVSVHPAGHSRPWRSTVFGLAKRAFGIEKRQAGGALDAALVSPLPGERGSVAVERARVRPRQPVAAAGAPEADRHVIVDQPPVAPCLSESPICSAHAGQANRKYRLKSQERATLACQSIGEAYDESTRQMFILSTKGYY